MSGSFKWTEEVHTLFVELCAGEVVKGNRVGTTLNKEGWSNVEQELHRQLKVVCVHKQMKNHWEKMKADFQIFKKLKFGESGLGWNELSKTIEAPESWWTHAIQANPKIKAFRGKDLTLFMSYYDTLFGDIVATGSRARTANTYSAVNLETGGEFPEAQADDGQEGSGDSEEHLPEPDIQVQPNMPQQPNLFPSPTLKSGHSSGSKRKRSGAEYICDRIDGIFSNMSSRSTQTTAAQMRAAHEEAAMNAAFDVLNSIEQLVPASLLYNFAGQEFLANKNNRAFFMRAPNNHVRYEAILYAYNKFNNH